jgi:thiosulfate/3-mercaptopyruvate sulfurtransferase
MLRAFGHDRSSVLDGGLPHFIAEGGAVDSEPPSVREANYPEPQYNGDVIRSKFILFCAVFLLNCTWVGYDQVVANSRAPPVADDNLELMLDARSRGR